MIVVRVVTVVTVVTKKNFFHKKKLFSFIQNFIEKISQKKLTIFFTIFFILSDGSDSSDGSDISEGSDSSASSKKNCVT